MGRLISPHFESNPKHPWDMSFETAKPKDGNISCTVSITVGTASVEGDLCLPSGAQCVVLFAHGSWSSRHSPRNQFVARALKCSSTGTLLFDLLTEDEEAVDARTAHLRFDIALLARRLVAATSWLAHQSETEHLGLGYFGASIGDRVECRGLRPGTLPHHRTCGFLAYGG